MYGYRQEYHAEAGGLGKAARPQGRQENDYPQGYAGTLYDGQSGKKPEKRERSPKGGMTSFLFRLVTKKPSAFESEIHPSHKSPICTQGISPLQGACDNADTSVFSVITEKTAAAFFSAVPSAYAAETAATDKLVAKRVCPLREKGVYGKTLIYTDVEAVQCQGKDLLLTIRI